MPNIHINAANITITFTDLEDVKRFCDAINMTEGARLNFKLIVLNTKKGKRVKNEKVKG